GDPVRLPGQELGGEVPERADDTRPDQLHLGEEMALARGDLVRLGVAVARRTALQHVRDVDVGPREPDRAEQRLEHLAGLADERCALAVLVVAGGLAHEHQIGVGMARPDHDLRPGAGERALLTSLPLGGSPVELGRADGCFAHGPHCVTRSGRSVAAAAAAAAASPAATAAGHDGPRSREGGQETRDRRGAAVRAADVVRLAPHQLLERARTVRAQVFVDRHACSVSGARGPGPAGRGQAREGSSMLSLRAWYPRSELEPCTDPQLSSALAASAPSSPRASAPGSSAEAMTPTWAAAACS